MVMFFQVILFVYLSSVEALRKGIDLDRFNGNGRFVVSKKVVKVPTFNHEIRQQSLKINLFK